jgi:Zn-dependent metalloprotease
VTGLKSRFVFSLLWVTLLGGTVCWSASQAGCRRQTEANQEVGFVEMEAQLPSDTVVRLDPENDTVTYLRGENLSKALEEHEQFRRLQSENLFHEIALAFITAYRSLFELIQPADELIVKSVKTDDLGLKHIRFQQVLQGIPVWACEIIVHLDRSNRVYLVQGQYIPTPTDVDIRPVITQGQACSVVAEHLEWGTEEPRSANCHPKLVIFAPSDKAPILAYRVLVNVSLIKGWACMVDAQAGDVLEKLSTVYTDGSDT